LGSKLDDDETELALLRRKKMAELIAREKKAKRAKEHQEKVGAERLKLLQRFLSPDALSYLASLKKREPPIGTQIEEVLLYLIVYRGLRQTINQIDIRYIERQIKGEGPTIKVQRDGETSDFASYVRDAIRKGNQSDAN
jgi:DNA-binding TFAR19-related protein (PDSD5 family)